MRMGLFKGFFYYLCKRHEKEDGLFTVAFIFLALISLFFLSIAFLLAPFNQSIFDIISSTTSKTNRNSYKLMSLFIISFLTLPIWLYFKTIKNKIFKEFDELNVIDKELILKKSKYIFYSFFLFFLFSIIFSILM